MCGVRSGAVRAVRSGAVNIIETFTVREYFTRKQTLNRSKSTLFIVVLPRKN